MGDLISRSKAIDPILKAANEDGAYGYLDAKTAVDLLNGMPDAEPSAGDCWGCKCPKMERMQGGKVVKLIVLTSADDGERVYINSECIEAVYPSSDHPEKVTVVSMAQDNDGYYLVKESPDAVANLVRLSENTEPNDSNEKNPKKIFIDWANRVQDYAKSGLSCLKKMEMSEIDLDTASDYFARIEAECNMMLSILWNTK